MLYRMIKKKCMKKKFENYATRLIERGYNFIKVDIDT